MSTSHNQPRTYPLFTRITAAGLASFHFSEPDEHDPTKRVRIPLDKSRGRVYKIDGDIYYSPNCSRDGVKEPRTYRDLDILKRDPASDTVNEFLQPSVWGNPLTTYLAFMPQQLKVYTPPIDCLSKDLPVYRANNEFWVDEQQASTLTRLEFDLRQITEQVCQFFDVPESMELFESAVLLPAFKSRNDALKAVQRTRDWFSLWVGMLSYNIAVAMLVTKDNTRADKIPTWWTYLNTTCLHSQTMLSSIRSSDLGGFHSQNRVGTFLQILDPPKDQPSVDFFHGFNVPVFYPWGTREAATALSDHDLQFLAPLPEQLQAVASYLVIQPSSGSMDAMAPWKIHRQLCLAKYETRLRNENNKQRSMRLNREKNLKTSGVSIYIWKKLNGVLVRCPADADVDVMGYGDKQRFYNSIDNEWDCSTLFGELESGEEEDMYEAGILVAESSPDPIATYNKLALGHDDMHHSIFSTSASKLSAPSTDIDVPASSSMEPVLPLLDVDPGEDVVSQRPINYPPPTVPPQLLIPARPVLRVVGLSRPTNSGTYVKDVFGKLQLEEHELVDLLMKYYGFRVPLHLPSHIQRPVANPTTHTKMALDLGSSYHEGFFWSPVATLAIEFWNALLAENLTTFNPEYWDLSAENNELRHSPRRQRFTGVSVPLAHHDKKPPPPTPPPPKKRRIGVAPTIRAEPEEAQVDEAMYVLDFGPLNTVPWLLAVFGVIDMHMVCRLPANLTETDLLLELVSRGTRCQTLSTRTGVPPQLPPPIATVPIRLPEYRFTEVDYANYRAHARALLQHPRIARAALLAGGILWRIALMFNASLSLVTNGPRPVMIEESFSYPSNSSGGIYVYDGLHPEEASVLCGLYHIYKSHAHLECISWFPLPSTWSSKDKQGFWTRQHEKFFTKLLNNYTHLDRHMPLSVTKWKPILFPPTTVRRAHKNLLAASQAFV